MRAVASLTRVSSEMYNTQRAETPGGRNHAMRTFVVSSVALAGPLAGPAYAASAAPSTAIAAGAELALKTAQAAEMAANISWVLTATVLVFMMAFPGLALFYAGLSRSKNSTNAFMQIILASGLGSLAFVFIGFPIAFGPGNSVFGGWVTPDSWFLSSAPISPAYSGVPASVFAIFQVAFAAVSISIVLGASVERVRFPFVLVFIPLWVICVYSPVAHWLWAENGWLRQLGAIDFAGGTVVHVSTGFSALALALILGPREGFGRSSFEPHSTALMALGAAFLIVGWYGFNAGSALAADLSASRALIATHVAACTGAVTWIIVELISRRYTTVIGVLTGVLGALVAITPASGYVTPLSAVYLGAAGAGAAYLGAVVIRRKAWFDDALDVFGVHGLAGMVGSLGTGVLAAAALAPRASVGPQAIAALVVALYALIGTGALVVVIRFFIRLRVSSPEERDGMDSTYHGEPA